MKLFLVSIGIAYTLNKIDIVYNAQHTISILYDAQSLYKMPKLYCFVRNIDINSNSKHF